MDSLTLSSGQQISIAINQAEDPKYVILLTHGAGAGLQHAWMAQMAENLAGLNAIVIRFNFPYMELGKKFPGSPKPNIATIGELVQFATGQFPELPIFLSGKSYGGRMSSHWVAENPTADIKGLAYFGFPLHAPGKVSKDRANHLYELSVPQLFVQGTNDALATFELIQEVANECQNAKIEVIENGDHSFKVAVKLRKETPAELMQSIAGKVNEWAVESI